MHVKTFLHARCVHACHCACNLPSTESAWKNPYNQGPNGLCNYTVCKSFVVQTLLGSLELVIHNKSWARHNQISFESKSVTVDNVVAGENVWKQMEVGIYKKNSFFNKKSIAKLHYFVLLSYLWCQLYISSNLLI